MEPLISVIVPIYNVKAYLDRCVESLLGQSYKDLEIFLVDGDDWVSPYYVENLYRALRKADADMAVSCFEEVFEGRGIQSQPAAELENFQSLTSEACLRRMLYQDGVETSTPTKLYKKELFEGLRYPVGKLYEDIPVAYEVLKRAARVAWIGNVDYYYFQRAASIQNAAFDPKKLDGVEHCRAMLENVRRDHPQLEQAAECRYLSTVCNILFQIRDKAHEPERKLLWKEVVRCRSAVVRDPNARKKARLAALLSYGGYPLLRFVYERTQWRGKTR